MRSQTCKDEPHQLSVKNFVRLLKKNDIRVSKQRETLLTKILSRGRVSSQIIDVGMLFKVETIIKYRNQYTNINVRANEEYVRDPNGYTGQLHRKKLELIKISEHDFIEILCNKSDLLQEVMVKIRHIDS